MLTSITVLAQMSTQHERRHISNSNQLGFPTFPAFFFFLSSLSFSLCLSLSLVKKKVLSIEGNRVPRTLLNAPIYFLASHPSQLQTKTPL